MKIYFLIIFVLLSAVLHGQINHIQPLQIWEAQSYYFGASDEGGVYVYRAYVDVQNKNGFSIEQLTYSGDIVQSELYHTTPSNKEVYIPRNGLVGSGDTLYFLDIYKTPQASQKIDFYVGKLVNGVLVNHKKIYEVVTYNNTRILGSKSGGFYLSHIYFDANDNTTFYLKKFDALLNLEWSKELEPSHRPDKTYPITLFGLTECQNGDVLLSGNWVYNDSNFDFEGAGFLARVNEQGVVWKKDLDIPEYKNERIFDVLELPNGNIALCEGKRYGTDKLGLIVQAQIKLYSGDGQNEIAFHNLPFSIPHKQLDYYAYLQLLQNGDFLAIGYKYDYTQDQSFGPYQRKVVVTRYKQNGLPVWTHLYSNDFLPYTRGQHDIYKAIEVPGTDSLLFIGNINNNETNQLRPWVFKTDGKGCIAANCEAVGIAVPSIGAQTLQVYPTPTSGGFTVISSSLKKEALHVYNMQGKLMKTGVVSQHTPWSMEEQLPPGLYFIQVGNQVIKQVVK